MKKFLLITLIILSYVAGYGQSAPVAPKQQNQNTIYLEPSTNRRWGWNGSQWYMIPDSTYIKHFVTSSGGDSIAFTGKFKNIGTPTKAVIDLNADTAKTTRMYYLGIDPVKHTLRYDTAGISIDTSVFVRKLPNGDVYIDGRLYPLMGFISDSASYITSNGGVALTINQTGGVGLALRINGGSYFNGQSEFAQFVQYDADAAYKQNLEFGSTLTNNHGLQWNINNASTNYYSLKFSATDSLLHYYHTYTGAFPTHDNAIATLGDIAASGITLTTTGSSGAATLIGGVLNIPVYSGASYSAGNGLSLSGTTFKADTSILQTVLNFFPKADARYYTKTASDAKYEILTNKATSFGTLNNTLYPTTQAVATYVAAQIPTTPSLQSVATVGNSYTGQIQAQNFAATGTGSNGYMDLISQSTSPTSTTSHIKIYSDSVNRLSWKNSTYRRTIQVPYPSDYTIRMPYLVTGTTLEDSTHASATYAPKFAGTGYSKFASGVLSYVTAIPNADLANSVITLNGSSTSLGGTFTVTKSNTDTTSTGFATHTLLNTYLTQASAASTYVPQTRTVAGFALSGNVTLASLTATNGTLTLTGTPYNGSSSASFGVNMANANTWTAAQTVNRANIVTTPTNSFIASNTTSATSPVPVQISGAYGYTAQVWNTSGTPATNSMNALTDLEPISSAAPVSNLSTYFQLNGGGYVLAQSLKSDGSILHTGTLVATANSQIVKGIQGVYTYSDGAFTGVIHDALTLNFGTSTSSYFHITDATGTGETDLHFGGSTPTSSNWAFRGNTASTYLNAPTTSVFVRVANTTVGTFGSTGFLLSGSMVTKNTPVALNSTVTATAAQVNNGTITSTSAAPTTITLPTATLLATQLSAAQGTTFEFVIDNSAGANIVTVALGSGMTQLSIITGSNTLTTAAGSVGVFRLYFSSTTAAYISRIE